MEIEAVVVRYSPCPHDGRLTKVENEHCNVYACNFAFGPPAPQPGGSEDQQQEGDLEKKSGHPTAAEPTPPR